MKSLGRWGEEKAVDYLRKKGFRVLARNFQSRFGELDIVAFKDGTLVFCEVKTRKNIRGIKPFEVVTLEKQERIKTAASEYLQKSKRKFKSVRFDVIAVNGDDSFCQLEHLENAFD